MYWPAQSDEKISKVGTPNMHRTSILKESFFEFTNSDCLFNKSSLKIKTPIVISGIRYLTLTDPEKVWMPDTFFRNEKSGHFHAILVNNVYVRVFPDGDVLYSIR